MLSRLAGLCESGKKIAVIAANPAQSKHLETATVSKQYCNAPHTNLLYTSRMHAQLMVLGQSVDFVNLRSEEYAGPTRIPTIRRYPGVDTNVAPANELRCSRSDCAHAHPLSGTPLEDALRRDLTINALFYNINESAVEDLTTHGNRPLSLHRPISTRWPDGYSPRPLISSPIAARTE